MIWMAVTADEYELPLSEADTLRGLASNMQLKDCTLFNLMKIGGTSRYKFNGYHYKVVKIEEEKDEQPEEIFSRGFVAQLHNMISGDGETNND